MSSMFRPSRNERFNDFRAIYIVRGFRVLKLLLLGAVDGFIDYGDDVKSE